jgi:hypothetical protein
MKRALLAPLIALAALSIAAPGAGASMIFGFNDSPQVFAADSASVERAGARIARVAVSWELGEPRRGDYDWSQTDPAAAALRAQGVRLLFVISAAPAWAAPRACSPQPPATCRVAGRHRDDYVEFADRLLRRYPGSKLQSWNEPNIRLFGAMAPRQAASITEAVAEVAPGRVIGPAAAPSDDGTRRYLAELYARLPRSVPMAIHIYPRTSFAVRSLGTYWRQAERIAGERPIWVTEIGFAESQFGPEGQAQRSADALRFLARSGAHAVIFHCLRDTTGTDSAWLGSLGALTADGTAKPVYDALRRAVSQLTGLDG